MNCLRILLPTLVVATLVSCHKPAKPRFEQMAVDTLLTHAMGRCQVEYRFATIVNTAKSEALRTIEQSNIGYFFELEEFGGTAAEAVAEALKQIGDELELPESASPSVRDLEYDISVESEGAAVDTLLCYTIFRSSYLGGAHGMYSTEYHNYSLASGYEYAAVDFVGEEKMEALLALIRTKLCARYGVGSDEELSAHGFFPEYFYVTDNIRIVPEGLVFHYNPYEISCYANGDIDVEVSREELAAL